jgi:hypothetical protein
MRVVFEESEFISTATPGCAKIIPKQFLLKKTQDKQKKKTGQKTRQSERVQKLTAACA